MWLGMCGPAGSELGVLKWRFQGRDESLVPLLINCWPSASGSDSYVNIEYESGVDYDLQHVAIAVPVPHLSHAPVVNQVSCRWHVCCSVQYLWACWWLSAQHGVDAAAPSTCHSLWEHGSNMAVPVAAG
eukprot:GHRR01002700.1.p5 GENE.GHRR01002700.1~~GHRR01002700.1.p5  ORF type:complete len:129 (-),score=36.89 GHRR01002700.1:2253-2639(-)